MKKLFFSFILGTILYPLSAQYTWIEKDTFTITRKQINAFTVNGMGYIVGGMENAAGNTAVNSVLEYNPTSDSWASKSNFPSTIALSGTFVINGNAYIVGGNTGNDTYVSTTYEYNSSGDTWVPKASFPENGVGEVFNFAINGIGYVGAGTRQGAAQPSATMYAYNPVTDSWTSKASYPGPLTIDGISFTLDSFAYVGMGYEGSGGTYNNLYRYNPANDSWTALNPFPGLPRIEAVAFVLNGVAYVGGGVNFLNNGTCIYRADFGDFYQYNPTSDTWTLVPGFMGLPRWGSSSFVIGNTAYVLGGHCDYNDSVFNTTYAFGTCNDLATALPPNQGNQQFDVQAYPNPSSGDMNIVINGTVGNKISYDVFSIDGKLVLQGSTQQNHFIIGTGKLQDAVYILQLKNDSGMQGIKRFEVIH